MHTDPLWLEALLWLWPAPVGIPAIILTTMYYKRNFAARLPKAVAAAA